MTIKKGQKRKMPVSPGRPKGIDLYMKQQQARLDAEVAAMKAGIEQQKNSTEVVRNANFVALMGQPEQNIMVRSEQCRLLAFRGARL